MAIKQFGNFSYDDSVWSDPAQTQLFNAIGRTEGNTQATGGSGNFFQKIGNSAENAFGTTGAALYESGFNLIPAAWAGLTGSDYTSHSSKQVNQEQEQRRQNAHKAIDDIYKQYGYGGTSDFNRLVDEANARGDQAELDRLLNNTALNDALRAQANTNASNVAAGANAYNDYRNNNYASQKINQDRGKFAGSAINTLNTIADAGLMVAGIPAGAVFNGLQGAAGGVADELEQNGLQNFDWERAKQNAIVGGTTGLVTGALNKGLSKAINPKTGNLFEGGNALTRGLNKLGSSTALGRLGSTIATGATRGAISGAVGGATGAGLSSALNGVEFGQGFQNALQGAVQGAKSGAITGGTMAGINKVANATLNRLAPNTAAAIRENQQRNASYGEGLRNQFKGAWESGDSNFKQWLEGKPSKILTGIGNIGNSVKFVDDQFDLESMPGISKNLKNYLADIPKTPEALQQRIEDAKYYVDQYNKSSDKTKTMLGLLETEDKNYVAAIRELANNGDAIMSQFKSGSNTTPIQDAYARGEESSPTTAKEYSPNEPVRMSNAEAIEARKQIALSLSMQYPNQVITEDDVVREFNRLYPHWVNTDFEARRLNTTNTPTTAPDSVGEYSKIQTSELNNLVDEIEAEYSKLYERGNAASDSISASNDLYDKAVKYKNVRNLITDLVGVRNDYYASDREAAALINVLERNGYINSNGRPTAALNNALKNATPTTAKDWVKKAGERFIEDAGKRGVGLGIKDVSGNNDDEFVSTNPEDYEVRNFLEAEMVDELKNARPTQTNQSIAMGGSLTDQADEILSKYGALGYGIPMGAPEYGEYYSQRFNALNELRDNFSDNDLAFLFTKTDNPEIKALISDSVTSPEVRNRLADYEALGPDVDNIYKNGTTPTRTQTATNAWDNLAQEAGYNNYDEVVQAFHQANPNAQINAGAVLTWLDNNPNTQTMVNPQMAQGMKTETAKMDNEVVPSKASKESKLRYAQGQELLKQYGTVDQPTARAAKNAAKSFQELADMGFIKPGDVEKIANSITGANGAVSKLNDSIIKSAAPVNTFEGAKPGQTIDDFIEESINSHYLNGTGGDTAVRKALNGYLRGLPSRTEGSVDFTDTAADTFELVQQLEASSAELKGRGGSTYHRPTTQDLKEAGVVDDVANLLKERIFDGADVKTAMTPQVAAGLKALDPGNEKWATTVDKFVATAKTPKDLRAFQRPFVQASKYIDNQYTQAATVGGRMASSIYELPAILPTTKAGLIKQGVNMLWNSPTANRTKAKYYGYMADREAAKNATPINTATEQTAGATPTSAQISTPTTTNPSNWLYNAIGREEGASNADAAQYLAAAAKEAEVVPKAPNAGVATQEDYSSPTSLYNSIYGTQTTSSNSYFPTTGDYWTDVLGKAMTLAMDANDASAFGSLYSMYQNALANQQSATSSATKLTDKQRQADAAMRALEDLEQSENNFAYDVSDIPVIGNIANFGGNDYQSKVDALTLQVGYMLSGATINKDEAKRILDAYIPKPRDNATVRQNKLNQLRGIISEYQRSTAE